MNKLSQEKLDAIRMKYENMTKTDKPNKGKDNMFWNPKEGTNTIRILPAKDDGMFFSETKIHRVQRPGMTYQNNIVCLEPTHGKGICPLCNLNRALWATKSEENITLARSIKSRDRYFANIISREDAIPVAKVFSFGEKLLSKILCTMVDSDFGDITDWNNGYDFKVHKAIIGGYPNYDQSGARPKPSPVGSGQDIAFLKESLHDLSVYTKTSSYEDVKAVALELTPAEMLLQISQAV